MQLLCLDRRKNADSVGMVTNFTHFVYDFEPKQPNGLVCVQNEGAFAKPPKGNDIKDEII